MAIMFRLIRSILFGLLLLICFFMIFSAVRQVDEPVHFHNTLYMMWLAIGCLIVLIVHQWLHNKKEKVDEE
jgi:Co/Zn/Cd efflux system component